MPADETSPDDGLLVALIDDRLPAEARAAIETRLREDTGLRTRLAQLQRGGLGLTEGFAALSAAAPRDRLEALLAGALDQAAASGKPAWRLHPAAVAAGFALFLIGAASGHWLPSLWQSNPIVATEDAGAGADGWRAVVAEYFPLTTSQTLQALPRDPIQIKADLDAAGRAAALELSPERLAVPGLTLARVDLLRLDDRALVQISYIDPQNGPVALCILARPDAVATPQGEHRGALNISWWGNGTQALMLIGRAPAPQLQRLAERLAGQLRA